MSSHLQELLLTMTVISQQQLLQREPRRQLCVHNVIVTAVAIAIAITAGMTLPPSRRYARGNINLSTKNIRGKVPIASCARVHLYIQRRRRRRRRRC